jgi:nucleotide-binding universal stress UspA family protein
LEELEKTAELLPAAVAGVRLGDRANRHLQRFTDAARHEQRLMAMAGLATLLDGCSAPQVKTQFVRALTAGSEAGEAMQEADHEETLEDAVEAFQNFIQTLAALEGLVRQLWVHALDRQFGSLSSVGALLQGFPSARDLGQRMAQVAAEAHGNSQTAVVDLLPKARALIEQRKSLIAEQQVVAGTPDVAAFLQALAENRATLDFLKPPKVLEWLERQNALTSLKVTAAQNARNL